MPHVLNTIIPVFAIILLGWVIRSWGFLPDSLIQPLNRIVYYLAIPAMIFREVAGATFQAHFNPFLLVGTLIPVIVVAAISLGLGLFLSVPRYDLGTFLQSSFHGNLGQIGLAVAYYLLGKEGLTTASILAGFLMLLQNILAVLSLQWCSPGSKTGHRAWFFFKKVCGNPIIIATLMGIVFSLARIPLPETIERSLSILSGMALPLALLVIGASLSFSVIRSQVRLALGSGLLKLLILPMLGIWIYRWFGLASAQFLPGLILLASPTATVTYVMASEMKGSTQLASAAVSMSTLISSFTFVLWLGQFSA